MRRKITSEAELVSFYDDFVEFHDNCSFLCDAIAAMVGEEEYFDRSTYLGIKRYCYRIKDKVQELKQDLASIQENRGILEKFNGFKG